MHGPLSDPPPGSQPAPSGAGRRPCARGRSEFSREPRRAWLRLSVAALAVSLAGLIAVTVRFVGEADKVLEEIASQADLSLRQRQLQDLQVALGDAESGQRGYLLTGNDSDLGLYKAAIARLPALTKSLADAHLEDPGFERQADAARAVIADRLAELAEAVRLESGGSHAAAMALVGSDRGRDDMERARTQLGGVLDIVATERERIGQRIAAGVVHGQHLLLLAVGSLLVLVALVAVQALQGAQTRRRLLQILEESERRHRALVEDQNEFVSLARADGTLVYVNPAFARHFEREPAALVGSNRFDLIAPAEREAARTEVAAVLRSGRERSSENRIVPPDGEEHWVAWTNKRHDDVDGVLLHSVGRDITQRKRVERALRANQSFLQRTSRLAGVGGWEHDLLTGSGLWSEEVRRILEADEDAAPRRADEIASYAPEARATMDKAMADCIERGVSWDLELPRITATGRRIWVRTVGSLEFENGQPRRIVGALQDITERKLLEQALADGERFLRQITDGLAVRIAYFDSHSRYRFVNLAHCRRYGKEREQIIGRSRAELLPNQDHTVIDAHIAAALRGQARNFEYEEVVGDQLRRIDARLVPDVGEDGRVRGFYATGVDITERVAGEARLRDLTQVLELNPDFILQTDRLGGVAYMNPALRQALGLDTDESLAGRRFTEFNPASTNERYLAEIQPALRVRGVWRGETTLQRADGALVPVNHLVIAHRDADGRLERFSAVMRDISSEVAARDALMLQTSTLQSVTEALPAMIAVIGRDGRYRFVNSAFERWAQRPRAQMLGRLVQEVLDPAEYAKRRPWIARVLAGETVGFESSDPAREFRHLAITYVPLIKGEEIDGYVGVAQDITPHREETLRLLQLTQRDAVTGLLDRAGLDSWLARRADDRAAGPTALLHIALAHFQPVGDTFGRAAADAVLRQFAQRLLALSHPQDAVARVGPAAFALARADMQAPAEADALAERIVAVARQPFAVGALDIPVEASVGVAWHAGAAAGDAHALVEQARAAQGGAGAGR